MSIARTVYNIGSTLHGFFYFFGQVTSTFFTQALHPKKIQYKQILKELGNSTVSVLVILSLVSFLVGIVTAYQSAALLGKYGANIFLVEISIISLFREMIPVMVAVVYAGRTSSSYTAEIGAMKLTDEIDAMKVFGLDPHIYLVIPKVVATLIGIVLMTFYANIIGVLGTMAVGYYELGISVSDFIIRLGTHVHIIHFFVGMIKAPFFGLSVAIIGCYMGFLVSKNSQELGTKTTQSVVYSIIALVVINATFSLLSTYLRFF